MQCQTITLTASIPCNGFASRHLSPRNPRFLHPTTSSPIFSCRGIDSPILNRRSCSPSSPAEPPRDEKLTSAGVKNIDVATLGNLCVDIVLNVPELPPPSLHQRKAYMEQLSASPPDKKHWEAGGNCNMAIAAARLGLQCITIGHVGKEIYGKFLVDVLNDEGISIMGVSEDIDYADCSSPLYETLLCWVLVDPMQRHGFCSRADFFEEPAFSWLQTLSGKVRMAIKQSKVLFCNGYGFDELPPSFIISSVEYAIEMGTSIFFDPGPRGRSLLAGTPEEQSALHYMLSISDVLLLTSEEAESLTGKGNPILAGRELLKRGTHTKWVIVKLGSGGSILVSSSKISCAPTFKVNVVDTVGCGDSFVAAIAFGFIHDLPTLSTLAVANAVGAATAMGCGAGRNVAKLERVIELMRASDLHEDYKFWYHLIGEDCESEEVSILSNIALNGNGDHLNHVSMQKVASELLPKLEAAMAVGRLLP